MKCIVELTIRFCTIRGGRVWWTGSSRQPELLTHPLYDETTNTLWFHYLLIYHETFFVAVICTLEVWANQQRKYFAGETSWRNAKGNPKPWKTSMGGGNTFVLIILTCGSCIFWCFVIYITLFQIRIFHIIFFPENS